jgi:hypothetical protein
MTHAFTPSYETAAFSNGYGERNHDLPAQGSSPRRLGNGVDGCHFSLVRGIDQLSRVDSQAKKIKIQELVDRRFLDEMEKSGFFDKLWGKG